MFQPVLKLYKLNKLFFFHHDSVIINYYKIPRKCLMFSEFTKKIYKNYSSTQFTATEKTATAESSIASTETSSIASAGKPQLSENIDSEQLLNANQELLKFSTADNEKLLKILNGSDSKQLSNYNISKDRIKKIQSWKLKYGSFQTLDQLLDIDGFGVKILNKFCKSMHFGGNNSNAVLNSKVKTPISKRIVNFVYPNLNETQMNNIKTFTSVNVSPTMITWAKFRLSTATVASNQNQRANVINWEYFTIEDKKYHLNDLIMLIGEISERIPFADVYILENPQVIQNIGAPTASPIQINVNLQKSQIFAMLCYMLANRNKHDGDCDAAAAEVIQQKIYYMKSYVVARLFNTLVGNERVSTKSVVETLLRFNIDAIDDGRIEDESLKMESLNNHNRNDIHMDFSISQLYKNAENFPQEYMGRALLLGISFLRLCLINRNIS